MIRFLLPNAPLRTAFAYFGLLYLTGALMRPLSHGATDGESPALQMMGLAIYAITGLVLLRYRTKIQVGYAILFPAVIVGFAFMSVIWSPFLGHTVRRSIGLAGGTAFAFALCAMFNPAQLKFILSRFVLLFIAFQLLMIVALPHYGIHQASDALYSMHAGRVRGTYLHKNGLGHVLAGLLVVYAFSARRSLGDLFYWGGLIVGLVVLLATDSAQTFIAVPISLMLAAFLYKIGDQRLRLALIAFGVGFTVYFVTVFPTQEILSSIFAAVGRDANMSNRTPIWETVIRVGSSHWVLGGGYGAAWSYDLVLAMREAVGENVGNAHNGYLQAWLELGIVGVGLVVAFVLTQMFVLLGNREQQPTEFQRAALAYTLFYILVNFAGAYLLVRNDIVWFYLVLMGLISSGQFARIDDQKSPKASSGWRGRNVRGRAVVAPIASRRPQQP